MTTAKETTATTKNKTSKAKSKSIVAPRMQTKTAEEQPKTDEVTMTAEQEAFVNGASSTIVNTETQPDSESPVQAQAEDKQATTAEPKTDNKPTQKKKGKVGRPALGIEKKKVTFDMPVKLIDEIDQCAYYFGMTRASYVARAVMKQVREDQKTENLDLYK